MGIKNTEINTNSYTVNGKILSFNEPKIMGIINLTPNSFYDGNKYSTVKDVMRDVESKIEQGADIIDVGAASTKPGEPLINFEEEWQRLHTTLIELKKQFPNTFISVDTYNSETAKRAVDLGVEIINDISGGNFDNEMFNTISKLDVIYILMHIQGTPQNMQVNPEYINVVEEVYAVLKNKTSQLKNLNFNKIIIDPGFGFGKTIEHNFKLLKELQKFNPLGFPVLAGLSRKSMINKTLNTNPVTALNGTVCLNTIALINGAKILRVHDVMEAKQIIQLFLKYQTV
ncbi:MAG: dihydropteroate synthase [Bacteroidetes bacterium]|nr:dihydropteroate synthase [Bacteroidota bacterium]